MKQVQGLSLALLMIVSCLAGCIGDDAEEPEDRTSEMNQESEGGNQTTGDNTNETTAPEMVCYNRMGHYVTNDTSQDSCEAYMYLENHTSPHAEEEFTGCYNSVTHTQNDGMPQDECESFMWVEMRDHSDDDDRSEMTQEDCELRNGTWTEATDRPGEFYCDFGEDDREDDSGNETANMTEQDCNDRNGTWTEEPDSPGEFYCDLENENNSGNNTEPRCGDGVIDANEECDDGNSDDGDGCSSSCAQEDDPDECESGAQEERDGCTYNCVQGLWEEESCEPPDSDDDGVWDGDDAFPNDANETDDSDGDGVGDNGDAFPNDANETADSDGDGVGDNADQCDDTESGATIGDDGCEEAEPQVHFIDISGMAFSPSTLTISVGDTVTWTNQDGASHTATGDNGEFDSGTLNNGNQWSFTFTTAGTYTYHCGIHNSMTATIIVQ